MQSLSGYWFQHQLKTCLSYPMADTLAGWVYDAKVDSHSQRHNYPGLWPVQWSGGTKYLLSNPSEMQLTILTMHGHSSPKFSSCPSLQLNFIVLPLPDNTENSILSELTFILCTLILYMRSPQDWKPTSICPWLHPELSSTHSYRKAKWVTGFIFAQVIPFMLKKKKKGLALNAGCL